MASTISFIIPTTLASSFAPGVGEGEDEPARSPNTPPIDGAEGGPVR